MKPALLASLVTAGTMLLAPARADACCGFYVSGGDAKPVNDATVVVLMRDAGRTVVSLQTAYRGPAEDFALVVPVPAELEASDVRVLRNEVLDRLDRLSAPRLVELWEVDPCTVGFGGSEEWTGILSGSGTGAGTGSGFGEWSPAADVKVAAKFAVGEYELTIVSASESSSLDAWLREHGYTLPAGAEPLLRPHVERGSSFLVAKVNPRKLKLDAEGRAILSPLRFHYDSEEFSLPIGLGLLDAPDGGNQDLLIYTLGVGQRYEVANHPNVTIPTNLDVTPAGKQEFDEFYAALFDRTLAQNPGAVVTEYSWPAPHCSPCADKDVRLNNEDLLELGADVLSFWSEELLGKDVKQVSVDKPTVGEGLDADIVTRLVRAHHTDFRRCHGNWEKASFAGKIVVSFDVDVNGNATKPRIDGAAGEDEMVRCLATAISSWRFPKPSGGATAVSLPVWLTPMRSRHKAGAWVLTRLHARLDASTPEQAFVLPPAPAIAGGRESYGQAGELEIGATPASGGINNFQARYAIRHPWEGKLDCETPNRGVWDGRPGKPSKPIVARRLATTSDASLAELLTESASARLQAHLAASMSPEPEKPEPSDPAELAQKPEAKPEAQREQEPSSGCACSLTAQPSFSLLGLFALLGLRRRR